MSATENAVDVLIRKACEAKTGVEAMQFAQAACNAVQAQAMLKEYSKEK